MAYLERFCIADYADKSINTVTGGARSAITIDTKNLIEVKKQAKLMNDSIFGSIKIPYFETVLEDIKDSWWAIACSMLLCFVLVTIYFCLMSNDCCVRITMYTMLALFFVSIGVLGYGFYEFGSNVENGKNIKETTNPEYYKYAAFAIWAIG